MSGIGATASIQTWSRGDRYLAHTGPCRCLNGGAGFARSSQWPPIGESIHSGPQKPDLHLATKPRPRRRANALPPAFFLTLTSGLARIRVGRLRKGLVLAFGDHRLDIERRELRCGGELIDLEPKVFDLLGFLVQNRNRVVSKDDLLQDVWGGRIVSESALTTRIDAVRRALGDDGTAQRLLRTFTRKGIRFVGEVTDIQTRLPGRQRPAQPFQQLPTSPRLRCCRSRT